MLISRKCLRMGNLKVRNMPYLSCKYAFMIVWRKKIIIPPKGRSLTSRSPRPWHVPQTLIRTRLSVEKRTFTLHREWWPNSQSRDLQFRLHELVRDRPLGELIIFSHQTIIKPYLQLKYGTPVTFRLPILNNFLDIDIFSPKKSLKNVFFTSF